MLSSGFEYFLYGRHSTRERSSGPVSSVGAIRERSQQSQHIYYRARLLSLENTAGVIETSKELMTSKGCAREDGESWMWRVE